MSNIVVTSTANYIKVDFGVYYPTFYPVSIAYYNASLVNKVELFSDMVKVHMNGEVLSWELSYDGSAGFQVDSIDGISPSSNSDLCDKISDLIIV